MIEQISNPTIVKARYLALYKPTNPNTIFISNKKNKKYAVMTPDNRVVHFGDSRYQDYTYHNDEKRREAYHNRFNLTKGIYSPYTLSKVLLW